MFFGQSIQSRRRRVGAWITTVAATGLAASPAFAGVQVPGEQAAIALAGIFWLVGTAWILVLIVRGRL